MKVAIFDTHKFEQKILEKAALGKHELQFICSRLEAETAILCKGNDAVSLFANDNGSVKVLKELARHGIKYIALRSAGYNHVDLSAAKELGIKVANVPEYSPYSVAEHAIAMMLALNRKIVIANRRIMDLNFSLDGLVGFDLNGKTVGIIGLGRIGSVVAKILNGFGCKILGYDLSENQNLIEKYGVRYVNINTLAAESDIITLHAPLTKDTKYLINKENISLMKKGVMIINTSRGALINTKDTIAFLKLHHIGYLGIDVYEEEAGIFFEDHSEEEILQDDQISRLMTFKNVLITSHQAFLTSNALANIADTTIDNLTAWEEGKYSPHELI